MTLADPSSVLGRVEAFVARLVLDGAHGVAQCPFSTDPVAATARATRLLPPNDRSRRSSGLETSASRGGCCTKGRVCVASHAPGEIAQA